MGGLSAVIVDDVELFRSSGSKIGLMLTVDKCEVITLQSASTVSLPNSCWTDSSEACLLGAPLFPCQALTTALEEKSAVLQTTISRLRSVPAHDALVFLRSSSSALRLTRVLRCSPCRGHPALITCSDHVPRYESHSDHVRRPASQ